MAFTLSRVLPVSSWICLPSRRLLCSVAFQSCSTKAPSHCIPLQKPIPQPSLGLQRLGNVSISRAFHQGLPVLWAKSSWLSSGSKVPLSVKKEAKEGVKSVVFGPAPALFLGLAGLVPFVLPPVAMMTCCYSPFLMEAQTLYGAAILSFLGGVRWGVAIVEGGQMKPGWTNLIRAVVPSLVAWQALMLPMPLSTLAVAGGLAVAGYQDVARPGYPSWFKGLRVILTSIAVLALCFAPFCQFASPKCSEEQNETCPPPAAAPVQSPKQTQYCPVEEEEEDPLAKCDCDDCEE